MVLKTLELKVADYMSPKPLVVKDDSNFSDAIQIMADKKIGNLIVEKRHKPIGILTERQILEHLSKFKKITDIKLKDLNLNSFEVVGLDTRVIDAAQLMIKKKTRLLVLDSNHLIGIITATDMVEPLDEHLLILTLPKCKVLDCIQSIMMTRFLQHQN